VNHKKKKAKNARAGCLLCKANKVNGFAKHGMWRFHYGFGKLRDEFLAREDRKNY
jgi:hypothetical protein